MIEDGSSRISHGFLAKNEGLLTLKQRRDIVTIAGLKRKVRYERKDHRKASHDCAIALRTIAVCPQITLIDADDIALIEPSHHRGERLSHVAGRKRRTIAI